MPFFAVVALLSPLLVAQGAPLAPEVKEPIDVQEVRESPASAATSGGVVVAPPEAAPPTTRPVKVAVHGFDLTTPAVRLFAGRKVSGLVVVAKDAAGADVKWNGDVRLSGAFTTTTRLTDGRAVLPEVTLTTDVVTIQSASDSRVSSTIPLRQIPGWLTLLPALLAIGLALWLKEVVFSLLGGIWVGVYLLHGSVVDAFPRSLDLMVSVVADASKIKVIVFTLGMGGLVGLVSAAGGTLGIVGVVSRVAKDARSTSLATWLMGMVVFFDDYASTLLVGNTMRPVTDRYRISREKLAYLVDSTAATITSLALVSTWIGYEVSTMQEAMQNAGIAGSAYQAFLAGLPSRFYPIFALLFVGMVAFSRRDFGPMATAELRARSTGKLLRDGAAPLVDDEVAHDAEQLQDVTPRAWFAALSIGGLIVSVVVALIMLGPDASYDALLYGSGFSLLGAVTVAVASRALSLTKALDAVVRGMRAMALAVLVLMLAWSVGKVMGDLAAGDFVATLVSGALPAWALPTVTFVLAAIMALATGTSWGTMAILFPVVVPIIAVFTKDATSALFLSTTSAVLAGAVFGDHCSPISDTTVLSSVASASDHVDHTRTQMPYALAIGGISIVAGTLPAGLGVPPVLSLGVGIALMVGVLWALGRPIPEYDPAAGE